MNSVEDEQVFWRVCRALAWIEDSTKDHRAKKPSFIPMLLRVPSRKKFRLSL